MALALQGQFSNSESGWKGLEMEHAMERVTFEGGRPSGPLPIAQIAFIVRDIDQALGNFHRTLGWNRGTSTSTSLPPSTTPTFAVNRLRTP